MYQATPGRSDHIVGEPPKAYPSSTLGAMPLRISHPTPRLALPEVWPDAKVVPTLPHEYGRPESHFGWAGAVAAGAGAASGLTESGGAADCAATPAEKTSSAAARRRALRSRLTMDMGAPPSTETTDPSPGQGRWRYWTLVP